LHVGLDSVGGPQRRLKPASELRLRESQLVQKIAGADSSDRAHRVVVGAAGGDRPSELCPVPVGERRHPRPGRFAAEPDPLAQDTEDLFGELLLVGPADQQRIGQLLDGRLLTGSGAKRKRKPLVELLGHVK
jgi:hypothetical protein